jgi:hypothetical protein
VINGRDYCQLFFCQWLAGGAGDRHTRRDGG